MIRFVNYPAHRAGYSAGGFHKIVFKKAKGLLLRNHKNIRRQKEHDQLKQLLQLNEVINTVPILREQPKHMWPYRLKTWAKKRWIAGAHWQNLSNFEP